MFVQYGWADADVSDAEHHVGAGLNWVGMIDGRNDDAAGVMVTYVRFTDESGAGYSDDSETAYEIFYKIQVNDYLAIKPDLQYIANPGGAGLDDAVVGTLRVELAF